MNVETERCKVCGAPLFYTAIFFPVMLKMLTFAGKYETSTAWKAEDNPLLFILSLYRVGYTAMFRIFAAKYETEYENIEIR